MIIPPLRGPVRASASGRLPWQRASVRDSGLGRQRKTTLRAVLEKPSLPPPPSAHCAFRRARSRHGECASPRPRSPLLLRLSASLWEVASVFTASSATRDERARELRWTLGARRVSAPSSFGLAFAFSLSWLSASPRAWRTARGRDVRTRRPARFSCVGATWTRRLDRLTHASLARGACVEGCAWTRNP